MKNAFLYVNKGLSVYCVCEVRATKFAVFTLRSQHDSIKNYMNESLQART